MNGKLYSVRAWALWIMVAATSAAVLMYRTLPPEWWVLFGIVIRDYFARQDRANGNGEV